MFTERDLSMNFELGQVAMLEGLVGRLYEKSGKAYAARSDAHARFLRDLADDLKREAAELRDKYNRALKNTDKQDEN